MAGPWHDGRHHGHKVVVILGIFGAALLLNYFGQGALLLENPEHLVQPAPEIDLDSVTCYVGGPMRITASTARNMPLWQKQLFVFMFRNATRSVAFYGLPSEPLVEIGIPVDL
jgi:K+ transporter